MTHLQTPLTAAALKKLKPLQEVLLSGTIYALRDAAHKRLLAAPKLPLDLRGQVIYYMGPAPARPGRPCGSCGPTTSARMDKFTPKMIEKTGIISIIGKGPRSQEARRAMAGRVVYFAAYGGLGALAASVVKNICPVCYADLGPEAVYKLEVQNMPLVVAQNFAGKGDIK